MNAWQLETRFIHKPGCVIAPGFFVCPCGTMRNLVRVWGKIRGTMSRLPALASVIGWPILSLLLVALLLGGCNQNRAVIIDATPEDQTAARQVNAVNATPTLNRQSYSLSTAVPVNMGSSTNPFGLLLGADGIDDQYRVELAKALGVTYFRPWYVNVEAWNGACYDLACDLGPNAGLKLILTARSNVGEAPPFAESGQRTYGTEVAHRATLLGRHGSVESLDCIEHDLIAQHVVRARQSSETDSVHRQIADHIAHIGQAGE